MNAFKTSEHNVYYYKMSYRSVFVTRAGSLLHLRSYHIRWTLQLLTSLNEWTDPIHTSLEFLSWITSFITGQYLLARRSGADLIWQTWRSTGHVLSSAIADRWTSRAVTFQLPKGRWSTGHVLSPAIGDRWTSHAGVTFQLPKGSTVPCKKLLSPPNRPWLVNPQCGFKVQRCCSRSVLRSEE
jgi:hypothetical protein